MRRRGFALIAVLWLITGVGVLAMAGTLAAREAVRGVQNRIAISRATWQAEGCLAVARSQLDAAGAQWDSLDATFRQLPPSECSLRLVPVGARVDVTHPDTGQLHRLFALRGIRVATADSLIAALTDWQDPDDDARPFGAERTWYMEAGRFPPRNAPLAGDREIARVRGFERFPELMALVTTEHGRIALDYAPIELVASLPGLMPETLGRLAERRARGLRTADWRPVVAGLSREGQDSIGAHMTELVALATWTPDAWLLTATAPPGDTRPAVTIELRFGAAGGRRAVVRRREY